MTDDHNTIPAGLLRDAPNLVVQINLKSKVLPGDSHPRLMVEVWVILRLFGVGVMHDIAPLDWLSIRLLCDWTHLPNHRVTDQYCG